VSSPFTRTTLWIVVGVAAVSLAAAAVLTIIGDDLGGGTPSAGADTSSRSAIGHRGLVALLERLDVPVVRSRNASAEKAQRGLLIVAEPQVSDAASRERLRAMVSAAPRTLLVLPKWYGRARPGATWVEEVDLVPLREIEDVLGVLQIEGTLARTITPWMGVRAARLEVLGGRLEGAPPPKLRTPQLLSTEQLEPIIAGDAGGVVLGFGTWEGTDREIWVLADPDAINNHGLRAPENARFAVALIDQIRRGGPVVFDEVIHGYAQPPSLLRTLFRFPIVLATLQVLICALLAVWAAMVRFGPRRVARPPLAPGKDFLIQNTAALLHYGGHHADALRRYLAQSVVAVRHVLHAPSLGPTATTAWLDRVGRARGIAESLEGLERHAQTADTPQRTIEVADRVHRWRMEMTHGALDRP